MREKMELIKKVIKKITIEAFVISYFLVILALVFKSADINMLEFVKCHMLVTGGMTLFALAVKLILEVVLLIKQLLEKFKIFLINKIKNDELIKKIKSIPPLK